MSVLLLRLAGPLQSWGTSSRFTLRDTAREPSKSGVIGLLGAALGVPRDDEAGIARLARLQMGVRVEREGNLLTDFHTVGGGTVDGRTYGVARAKGGRGGTVVSRRDYLADAAFLVALEDDDAGLLGQLSVALERPFWPLCLGRRCCAPTFPLQLGIQEGSVQSVLEQWPWRGREGAIPPPEGLRMVLEVEPPLGEVRHDVPVCFEHEQRRFRQRRILVTWLPTERVVTE